MEWMLYSKTWLQFVFPVYIQVLVGLVILISHSLLGSNPIPVLATLILLSYVKVLHTLIVANPFADLDYPGLNMRRVWVYDANIEYLIAKHIPLFLVALFVLLLFLTYTLLLLFGQWLQARSHLRLFSWVNSARLHEAIHGFIPCSIQSKTALLAWTAACALLCSAFSVCLQSSAKPQH